MTTRGHAGSTRTPRQVYVAPGDWRTKSGVPGETQNHPGAAGGNQRGVSQPHLKPSSGYTKGSITSRAYKELLAQCSKGLIGLSSCLKGEVAKGWRTARTGRHSKPQPQQGHPRRLERSGTASGTSAPSTAASPGIARTSACPWCARTTCTTCATPTRTRTTSCCASARANRRKRLRVCT